MKKLFGLLTLSLFLFAGAVQAQASKYMFTGTYELKFTDQVRIRAGNASQNKSTAEWAKGNGKVGNHTIDSKTFAEMQSKLVTNIKIEIESKATGVLHKIVVTDTKSGQAMNGLYNSKTNEFTFGSAKSTKQGAANKIEMGVVKAKLSPDKQAISNGEFAIGFIAGNGAVAVSADATFYFTGKTTDQ